MIDVIIACCIVGGVVIIVVAEVLYIRWAVKQADREPTKEDGSTRDLNHAMLTARWGFVGPML